MLRTRVIPCLQLIDRSLVKTIQFSDYNYIGDPVNTVRIFNELEVDELCFLDIKATKDNRLPNFKILKEIANECFMPLSYGGGITDVKTVNKILSIGFEKIVVNSAAYKNPDLITEIAQVAGSQSLIISIDVKKTFWGNYYFYINDGEKKVKEDPVKFAQKAEQNGAGEILLTSMDQDGTWDGYDLEIVNKVSEAVNIPVIANGGAGKVNHLAEAKHAGASALAVGSLVVYQSKGMGVLVNFPDRGVLSDTLGE